MQELASCLLICVSTIACSSPLSAQENSSHAVREITAESVGPYRPRLTADLSQAATLIVKQTNQFRNREKQATLTENKKLTKAAKEFAEYMARTGRYGHHADEQTPSERAAAQKYELCFLAENIAYQFRSNGFATDALAKQFVEGWKESPGHRENMLREYVTETGVAIAQSKESGVYFGVQLFGRPQSAAITFQVSNQTDRVIQYRIGNRPFRLQSKYTRSHRQCRPGELTLLSLSENNKEPKPVSTVDLKTQTKIIVVVGSDEKLKAEVVDIEKAETEPRQTNMPK